MRFRKKPIIIDAIQFTGKNSADIHEFCGNAAREPVGTDIMEIVTLEGVMVASPKDWIIRGVKGEFYPCKPDVFEKTYELVEKGMNKKTARALKKGYREAGQIYWTDEMTKIIKAKNLELTAYRVGFFLSLAFSAFVAILYARAAW